VKVHKKWGTEKEMIIRFARQGEIFGHRGLGQEAIYPISATALEPVNACFIDLDFFRASLKVNQDFMYGLLLFFADELQESERKMRNLAHMQVKGRVAQALLTLQEKFGRTPEGYIQITLSRQDLASLVGATYETVFRIINELAEEELIVLSGKNISINDAAKLAVYTKE
jgi:CRP/FNR family transcriptional regulator